MKKERIDSKLVKELTKVVSITCNIFYKAGFSFKQLENTLKELSTQLDHKNL